MERRVTRCLDLKVVDLVCVRPHARLVSPRAQSRCRGTNTRQRDPALGAALSDAPRTGAWSLRHALIRDATGAAAPLGPKGDST